jgi:NAD(P)H-hydrate epimerase
VVDIGIPAEVSAVIPANCRLQTAERFCADSKVRPPENHKGKNGHVLVVGGSPGKTGAAAMAANAAMRAGAGLVTLGCPWGLNPVLETQVMEAMTSPLPETADGVLDTAAVSRVLALSAGKQCLALGPGMGTAAETRQFLHQLMAQSRIPMVIDADGINCIAGNPELLAQAVAPVILTPHPGEMARLADTDTAAVQADRVAIARRFAVDTGTHLILKGAATVCAHPDGKVSINPSGNAGMASGGMGDVLTGIVAAFVAQGYAPKTACRMAAYLHGAAGDYLAGSMGPVGYLASDILEVLPTVAVNICANNQGRDSWPLKTVENSCLRRPVTEQ